MGDGIDQDLAAARHLGVAPVRVDDWFTPFGADRPHRYVVESVAAGVGRCPSSWRIAKQMRWCLPSVQRTFVQRARWAGGRVTYEYPGRDYVGGLASDSPILSVRRVGPKTPS